MLDVAIAEPHIAVPEAVEADAAWLLVLTASAVNVRSAPSLPVDAFVGTHAPHYTFVVFRAVC